MSKFEKTFAGGNPLKADELNQMAAAINDNDDQIASLREDTDTRLTELDGEVVKIRGIDVKQEVEVYASKGSGVVKIPVNVPKGIEIKCGIIDPDKLWTTYAIGVDIWYEGEDTYVEVGTGATNTEFSFVPQKNIVAFGNHNVGQGYFTADGTVAFYLKSDESEIKKQSTEIANKLITNVQGEIDSISDYIHKGEDVKRDVNVYASKGSGEVKFPISIPAGTEVKFGILDPNHLWTTYAIGVDIWYEDGTMYQGLGAATNTEFSLILTKNAIAFGNHNVGQGYFTADGVVTFYIKYGNSFDENVNTLIDAKNFTKYINILDKIVFVGDSVTDGHIFDYAHGGGKSVVRKWSYPASIHKLCPSIECINNGHSGESIQGYNGLFGTDGYCSPVDVVGANLVIVELGWNQSADGYKWYTSQSAFDTAFQNDVKVHGNDYANYNIVNSLAGNYCQLVKKIQNAIPNVCVICVASSNWTNLGNGLAVGFVQQMAEWLGVQFINMDDTLVGDDAWNKGSGIGDDVHSTPFGYYRKAEIMVERVSRLMQNKSDYFRTNLYKQIGWTE